MTVKSLVVGIMHHASLRRYLFPMVNGCLSEDLVFCCRFIGYQIWWETISLCCTWLLCVWLLCALQGETLRFRVAHNLSPASHETNISNKVPWLYNLLCMSNSVLLSMRLSTLSNKHDVHLQFLKLKKAIIANSSMQVSAKNESRHFDTSASVHGTRTQIFVKNIFLTSSVLESANAIGDEARVVIRPTKAKCNHAWNCSSHASID